MTKPEATSRYRWIRQVLVVVMVAGVFFALGRQSVHEQAPANLRARARELNERIASSHDVVADPAELEANGVGIRMLIAWRAPPTRGRWSRDTA